MPTSPGSIWRAPLVPMALAATAGIFWDRLFAIPIATSLLIGLACLIVWFMAVSSPRVTWSLFFLWTALGALAAAYHHWYRDGVAADDIGALATDEPRPTVLRGQVASTPVVVPAPTDTALRSFPTEATTHFLLRAGQVRTLSGWQALSGRVQVTAVGQSERFQVGDEVEVIGRLVKPAPAYNPGEFDFAEFLRDQGVHAHLKVGQTSDGVRRVGERRRPSVTAWLARLRGWGRAVLEQAAPRQSGLATALLLGDGSALERQEWEKYLRTGVIHVLAISGQHLAVLAAFLWLGLRLCHVPRRRGAVGVAVFLLTYALLAGGRPPVMRSAIMVLAGCGALWLRRPVAAANTFALAWLGVACLNPADLANAGCQLSFLSVAVLYWGARLSWETGQTDQEPDPLEELLAQSRPLWLRYVRWLAGAMAWAYTVNLGVWLAVMPLVAARYHLVSPIALVIGPPVVLLTSLALVLGFILLLTAPLCWPLACWCGWLTDGCLHACDALVSYSQQVPLAYLHVPDVPAWWLGIFYLGLLLFLTQPRLHAYHRRCALAALAWLAIGLLSWNWPSRPGELRCTFLAVGHGACTVLELPDGRTLLYDAGAMTGPDVTRRQIAPFLWQRGLRRLDEVFLSHADLDHFNGLPALLELFAVGQVTCTPSFADRPSRGVETTIKALKNSKIPLRVVSMGDQLDYGDVRLDVLHPPPMGPQGNENTRSLVLLVRHHHHRLLLTGDLEGPGLVQLLAQTSQRVDLLMAPHHGSQAANTKALANWARPKAVVSSQGPPKGRSGTAETYEAVGARFFPTWPHGAITIRSTAAGLVLDTFRSRQRWIIR